MFLVCFVDCSAVTTLKESKNYGLLCFGSCNVLYCN